MKDNKHPVQDPRLIVTLFVATCCCLGVVMYFRAQTDTNMYRFLSWDMFLAWVPFIISSCIRYIFHKKVTTTSVICMWLMCAVWLFFLPNAAYLFTEILHSFRYFDAQGEVRFWVNIDFWYGLTLTFAVAIIGLLLSTCSIIQIHGMLNQLINKYISMMVVGVILLLSSIGVYIGRFNRWNSWDILSRPWKIFVDLVNDFNAANSIMVEFVAIVFTVQLFGYVILSLLTARSSSSSSFERARI
ncbi:putative membrane protein [Paenibacillus sp. W4I10]|nr:putative membrane protein [Paenibacillus sp. W4I10]